MDIRIEPTQLAALVKGIDAGQVIESVDAFLAAIAPGANVERKFAILVLASSNLRAEAGVVARQLFSMGVEDDDLCLFLATECMRSGRMDDLTLRCLELCIERHPEKGWIYIPLLRAYSRFQSADKLIQLLKHGQKNISDYTLNWQTGAAFNQISSDQEKRKRQKWLEQYYATARDLALAPCPAPEAGAPGCTGLRAETRGGAHLGVTGSVVWGELSARGRGAVWYFEYGFAPNDLNHRTPERPVPGSLNAHYVCNSRDHHDRWTFYSAAPTWDEDSGFPLLGAPFGKDPNHLTGAGFLDLFGGVKMSADFDGSQDAGGGGRLDLRDASLKLTLRCPEYEAKDFFFVIGYGTKFQSGERTEDENWGLTGHAVDLESLSGPGDIVLDYRMTADPTAWTFYGNNPDEQGDDAVRHRYGPLGEGLAQHLGNFPMTGLFGDWRDTPEGAVQFKSLELTCRSPSVLRDPISRLVQFPDGGEGPPEGVSGAGPGKAGGWLKRGPVDQPIEFEWVFDEPLALSSLSIRNHPIFPVARVMLGFAQADGSWGETELSLRDLSPAGAVMDYRANLQLDGLVQRLRLTLLEGADPRALGVDCFEVFADGFVPMPDGRPASVSDDIEGLTPGATVYYRLVCADGRERAEGEIMRLDVPAETQPVAYGLEPLGPQSPKKCSFLFRGNAMGEATEICWRVDGGDWKTHPFGRERTSKHHAIAIRDLAEEEAHKLEVYLANETGESERVLRHFKLGSAD